MERFTLKSLNKVLVQKKRQTKIDPNFDYSLVTITNKGEVKLREKMMGSLIAADKAFIVKTGDFIYSRLAVHTGAFGIIPVELDGALVTSEMPCFEIDGQQITPKLLIAQLNAEDFKWQLKQLTKGVGRVRVKENMILGLSILIAPINEQADLSKKVELAQNKQIELNTEIEKQKQIIKKLRQCILQEAIDGKLTADWRMQNHDVEPARKLLERIATEKRLLFKEVRTKSLRTQSLIKNDEKPFELPNGWEWCRTADFVTHYVDCPHDTPIYQDSGFPCLRAPDVTETGLKIKTVRRVSYEEYQIRIRRLKPVRNDLVYIREGGRLGIAGLIDTDEPVCLGQRVMLLRFLNMQSAKYGLYFFNAPKTYIDIVGKTIGAASPHVNVRDVISHVIPIPPLEEQLAIVTKIDKLFAFCDQLESHVTKNQIHAKQLMHAVLKEAFSQSEGIFS